MNFEIQETDKFSADLEEAALWLYAQNLEQSEELADRKLNELEDEINSLKSHLRKNPEMGQADKQQGLRSFPIYSGRYSVSWIVLPGAKIVLLLALNDSKYPANLRNFSFDE